MAGTYNQLSFLDDYDKYSRRDERLVSDLLQAVGNFKYFKVNTRFSDLGNRKEIEDALSQILYWTAWLAWKKAKHVDKYKENYKLDHFLSFTKEGYGVSVTESLSNETLQTYFMNGHKRMKTTFMAYREILQGELVTTKRILNLFDHIHNLAHAV